MVIWNVDQKTRKDNTTFGQGDHSLSGSTVCGMEADNRPATYYTSKSESCPNSRVRGSDVWSEHILEMDTTLSV